MSQISDEIKSYLGQASLTDEEYLEHYGMPRRSGRYPWGSGKDPHQRTRDFLGRVEELKRQGWKETPENIKKEFGLTTTQYRLEKSISRNERRSLDVARAKSLKEDGLNNSEIGRQMGVRESVVRSWLNQDSEQRMLKAKETSNFLKEKLKEQPHGMLDVGKDVEIDLNISRQKLDTALYMLEREGYHVYSGRIPQPTNKNQSTTQKVLCAPGKQHKDIFEYDKVGTVKEYISRDGGDTYEKKFHYPASMSSKRIKIRYKDEIGPDGISGNDKDGIVEIRRGVKDLSLGKSRYAQVRILVDGTHYIKGMAVYSDDMPDGVDIVFNTNKGKNKTKMECLKEIKKDRDNPFGASIKDGDQGGQYWYDPKTGEKVSSKHPGAKLGLINKARDEGDWSEWANTLPSQFLSKQSKELARKQLNLAKADKEDEFAEIKNLTNPTVKKYYLNKFADSCDAAAVDLKAAALPDQKYHVIIPINTLKDNEIYAPRYPEGSKLALIRYPHGGIFEIPIVTVTHKNALGRKIIGNDSGDAVGVTKKVADRLSGADFDGDTVMCIPTHDRRGKVKINSKDELKGLKGFDNKDSYGYDDTSYVDSKGKMHYCRNGKEFKIMENTNLEMGKISNLITDMTLGGANDDELAAAVRHSMVVIDAEKHKLDYRQSYIDNNISALKKTYQRRIDEDGNLKVGGASTIISRSKSPKDVDKRRGQPKINQKGKEWYDPKKPEGSLIYTKARDEDLYYVDSTYDKKAGTKTVTMTNGKKITYNMNSKSDRDKYEPVMNKDPKTGEVFYTNKDGSISYRRKTRYTTTTKMADTDDAYTLVSANRHPMELIYADYANHMKAMANRARMEMIRTGNLKSDPTAKKIYKAEVDSLEEKLKKALTNSVKERHATRLATSELKRAKSDNPDMDKDDYKKLSQRTMSKYRNEVGSVSRRDRAINITDKEWEAIQAGAISENKLKKILDNTDPDSLRERSMPKSRNTLNTAQINRIKAMSNSNFTLSQIAEKMNIPPSTVARYLKGEK